MNEKVPTQHKHAWFGFLKSIATFRGDLSSLRPHPHFLLSPQSIVEFSAYWTEHPKLFVAPAAEEDPDKRALLVLRWFLSTLKQQHTNRDDNGQRKRMKPLNPFLGECFLGKWVDEAGTTNLVSEQVSHHPPATAFNCWNDEHGVRLQGHIAPKVYFNGTVHIDRKGYGLLHIDRYNEDYLITMPKMHIEGLMTGELAPELSGSTFIHSSSGYTAKIDYSGKGWLSGKRNCFSANLYRDGHEKDPLYTVEGQWCDHWVCRNNSTKAIERFDINAVQRTPLQVAPMAAQHPLESRRAWQHVADAIHKGDMFAVGHEKGKIENEQREMRKREKGDGKDFSRRYFSRGEHDVVADELGAWHRWPGSTAGWSPWCLALDEKKYQRIQTGRNGIRSPRRERFDSGVGGMLMDEESFHMTKDLN